jgi:hypothetical protein
MTGGNADEGLNRAILGLKEACQIIGNLELVALQHYQIIRPQSMKSAVKRDREARKGRKLGRGKLRDRPETIRRLQNAFSGQES